MICIWNERAARGAPVYRESKALSLSSERAQERPDAAAAAAAPALVAIALSNIFHVAGTPISGRAGERRTERDGRGIIECHRG